MKLGSSKFIARIFSWESLSLIIPFFLWVFCYRDFFSGHLSVQQDAVSYSDHIKYYTTDLSRGVFPLWDPDWYNGAPYHFFLRRIGDVNPFLFLIVLLKWLGVPIANAYLFFLGFYYFLAGLALYLITRLLLAERFFAFSAYIFFIFSSWGSEIFYNYIIIIFVPIIWFFYFLLSFARSPHKGYFLGICLCLGLILTTYIPFFFLTIFALFSVLFVLFYAKDFIDVLKRSFGFFSKNRAFSLFCIILLILSVIPAVVFYNESKVGQFVLPDRHSGSDTALAITVGLNNVASGDIINHGFVDHLFSGHRDLDMGDIYLPCLFFIMLLVSTFARLNKLILFLLFNIFGLFLISITTASGVHRFLYEHIVFFKIIRNIYYFFWLAILPMAILLTVTAFQSFLKVINASSQKAAWLVYIVICYLIFIFFMYKQQDVLPGAWVAILISLVYFLIYFSFEDKVSYRLGYFAVFLAVSIQSVQVYECLSNRMYQIDQGIGQFAPNPIKVIPKKARMGLYYTSPWFNLLTEYLDPDVLDNYRSHKFIFYDNVLPYNESPQFFNVLGTTFSSNTNVAYVSKSDSSPDDWRRSSDAAAQADIDPVATGKMKVVSSDSNTWKIKTHLYSSQFLVVNDNYNTDWHAFINGHPARLLRANVSFKGLWVPSGDSNIVLRFSNPMRYALHISLVVLFAGSFLYLLVLLKFHV